MTDISNRIPRYAPLVGKSLDALALAKPIVSARDVSKGAGLTSSRQLADCQEKDPANSEIYIVGRFRGGQPNKPDGRTGIGPRKVRS